MTGLLRTLMCLALLAAASPGPSRPDPAVPAPAAAVAAVGTPQPGRYTGPGFDACTAPPSSTMDAWLTSPYRAVGIYFGGSNRFCTQPELTAAWVAHQEATGWHLLPIYLGLQAPCTTSSKKYLIDPARAAAQGRAEASTAMAAAAALGLPRGSTLIFDMEAYRTGVASCRTAVLTFLGAWTGQLHHGGYLSGVYSSIASGVTDLVGDYTSTVRPRPDYLAFARYDGVASTVNPAIPTGYWAPHRRVHQYAGGHRETFGGASLNIDNDWVDVAPLPTPAFGDVDGNGWPDLIARDTASHVVYLYPGNGAAFEPRVALPGLGTSYDAFARHGDLTGDGRDDVIARNRVSGRLWLYPASGSGWGSRIELGNGGWNAYREITAAGDLTGDGRPDLLAVDRASGYLYLFPGRGTALGTRISMGPGWNTMSELTGIGDLTGDGHPDLLARLTATGVLYLYAGTGRTGFAPRVSLGSGWGGRRDLVGIGDTDRDGRPDLLAVDTATGVLYRYPGRQGGFGTRVRLGAGWGGRSPLF